MAPRQFRKSGTFPATKEFSSSCTSVDANAKYKTEESFPEEHRIHLVLYERLKVVAVLTHEIHHILALLIMVGAVPQGPRERPSSTKTYGMRTQARMRYCNKLHDCRRGLRNAVNKKKSTISLPVYIPKQAVSIPRNLVQEKIQWRKLLLKALQVFPVYSIDLRAMPITTVTVKHLGD
jgi:hypothetical protein